MTERVFLYVFPTQRGTLECALYRGDLPPRSLPRKPIYARELTGKWAAMPLAEIIAEYQRRAAAQTLPPGNMSPPPKPKAPGAKTGGRPARPWRTGDLAR